MFSNEATASARLRRYPWLPTDRAVQYRAGGDAAFRCGRFHALGGGGIAFESDDPLPPQAAIDVVFDVRPGVPIAVAGRVLKTSGTPAGAYVHRMPSRASPNKQRATILDYIFETWRAVLLSQT